VENQGQGGGGYGSGGAVLQCGHGTKAVENDPPSGRRWRRWSRFNAATARRPWRT